MSTGQKYVIIIIFLCIFTPNGSVPAEHATKIIHVFVALCDNVHQGIVPVPPILGNGDDPVNNLYWGAMYGVKTFFRNSQYWELLKTIPHPSPVSKPSRWKWLFSLFNPPTNPVLERCIFQHLRKKNVYIVADAYQGREIKQTVIDFLNAASGTSNDTIILQEDTPHRELSIHGNAQLLVYVGHDGLMDFQLWSYPEKQDDHPRDVMILACFSKQYFYESIRQSGATPLLWTTGRMAPEAYTLEQAIEGWIEQENAESIHLRAAKAYHKYQQCGLNAAKRLFATGLE